MTQTTMRRRAEFGYFCSSVLLRSDKFASEQTELSTAASQMAAAINKSKEKTVALFDFVGPNDVLTPLGREIADEFNRALVKSHAKFKVADRNAVAKSFPEEDLAPATAADKGLMVSAALDMGWKAAVVGSFTVEQDAIVLSAEAARAESGDQIALVQAQIPITDALKQLIPASEGSSLGQPKPPLGGKAGYSVPRCIDCPDAVYTNFAAHNKVQGIVVLSAIVTLDGRPADIDVVEAIPGLTTSAIRAVSRWKFRAATDPNGNPTVVRATIAVTFRLF